MFVATLRRVGNSSVVTVPRDELQRIGLRDGQTVVVEVRAADIHIEPQLAADLEPSVTRVSARPRLRNALRLLGS